MSVCCISGCKNRRSSNSKLKYYRIPSEYRTFNANRRRLWLQAIQQVNGSTKGLGGHVRVCSAHFISGEASMERDSPDFVPSVFKCTKQSPKRKVKRFTGRRKRRRRTAKAETEETTTSPRAESPEDLQSSGVFEETQKPLSPSVPEEGETLTKESEDETETIEPQATSSPIKASQSFKAPAYTQTLDRGIPIVLLKPVYTQARGFQCELCDQNFTNISQLLQHKQLHEEEKTSNSETFEESFISEADFTEEEPVDVPSFPCNICDRSFITSHHLKRHKLLHVKDGRKCPMCGVLFCQRHNHVLFLPQTESVLESEEDSSVIETENNLEKPNQITDLDDDAHSTLTPLQTTTAQTVLPAPQNPGSVSKTLKPLPPASHTRVLTEIPVPVLINPSSVPPMPVPWYSRNPVPSSEFKQPLPVYPATFSQQNLPKDIELPPSLQMFSPKFLTSAFFEVTRNYEYILSKSRGVKKEKKEVEVRKEEVPLCSTDEQCVEDGEMNETAFDLDVVF